MNLYFAPLEGITTYVYRAAHRQSFPACADKYFAPFLMPHVKRDMNFKEKRDLAPENNAGIPLVPQLLTDSAEDFLRYQRILTDLGYEEINLNLGCPSPTVTSKGRGAAFLARTEELDRFLDTVFSGSIGRISVKSRIGVEAAEEFPKLLEIFNRYPIEELILHPRTKKEFYGGLPHREAFLYAMRCSTNPLVFNGDLWTVEDAASLDRMIRDALSKDACRQTEYGLMLGRPGIADPALFRKLKGGPDITEEEQQAFLDRVVGGYREMLHDDHQILFRMKELWTWMIRRYPGHEKTMKKMLKQKHLEDFLALQDALGPVCDKDRCD